MAALPSAFFIHVSQAWCSVWPRYWMAKSTIVVVPPWPAAIVPDLNVSADLVPPNALWRGCVARVAAGEESRAGRLNAPLAPGGRPLERRADGRYLLAFDQY